jgi:hypothetical protein
VFVRESTRKWVGEVLPHDTILGVAPMNVITGEAGLIAEVFAVPQAVGTCAIGRGEPGNSYAIACLEIVNTGTEGIDQANDLMSGNDGDFGKRQVTLHDVKVGVANGTTSDPDANFAETRFLSRKFGQTQRRVVSGFRGLEQQGAHLLILVWRAHSCARLCVSGTSGGQGCPLHTNRQRRGQECPRHPSLLALEVHDLSAVERGKEFEENLLRSCGKTAGD